MTITQADMEAVAAHLLLTERATTHCRQKLTRVAQQFQHRITDEESAKVMFAVEAGYEFNHGRVYWRCAMRMAMAPARLHAIITELVRTGLLRDYRDPRTSVRTLLPAHIHLDVHGGSACRFVGEDLGPMRTRLSDDLALVDCRDCLAEAS